MKLISRLLLYAISSVVITCSLYLSSVPVAAMVFPQNSLPVSGDRVIQPREYLYLHAGSDAKAIDRIIQCESSWNPKARSQTSSATGLGQFLDSTWISTRRRMGDSSPSLGDRTDPTIMLDTMIWLYQHDGERHWLESKPCWNR